MLDADGIKPRRIDAREGSEHRRKPLAFVLAWFWEPAKVVFIYFSDGHR